MNDDMRNALTTNVLALQGAGVAGYADLGLGSLFRGSELKMTGKNRNDAVWVNVDGERTIIGDRLPAWRRQMRQDLALAGLDDLSLAARRAARGRAGAGILKFGGMLAAAVLLATGVGAPIAAAVASATLAAAHAVRDGTITTEEALGFATQIVDSASQGQYGEAVGEFVDQIGDHQLTTFRRAVQIMGAGPAIKVLADAFGREAARVMLNNMLQRDATLMPLINEYS